MASPYVKIKTLLLEDNNLSITGLAKIFNEQGIKCTRDELSKCIHGQREYPHLREAIAHRYNTTVEKLFGKAAVLPNDRRRATA